jgi:hypothetical protein
MSCQFSSPCDRSARKLAFRGRVCGAAKAESEVKLAVISEHAVKKHPRRIEFLRFANCIGGGFLMVITAAHIQPIVALIAGVLILLMPRFLNLLVAVYLIFVGLSGLGVFKMLHF